MMDWQTPHERTDRETAADLGLTPLAPAYTAPDWWLDGAPDADDFEPRYLCCEHAYEWQLHTGPSEAALLEQARELATQQVLRGELDRRDLAARNESQAAELARLRELRAEAADRLVEQVNAAQKDADHWTEKYYALEEETHAELTKAGAPIFGKDGVKLALNQRIAALKPYTGPVRHKQDTEPREPIRDKESAVLSLAYLRAYIGVEDINTVRQHAYPILCELTRVWHQRGTEWYRVLNRVREAGIMVGPTPQDASPPVKVIKGQGGIHRKDAS